MEFWINISKHHNHPFARCYTANFMGEEIEAKINKITSPEFYRMKYVSFSKYMMSNQKVCYPGIL